MKRIGLFFLSVLLCRPVFAVGDACTDPDEYTIDKRCYVTEEQKLQSPYNAVVATLKDGGIWCTGTIVKNRNDKLYMFTAKHCVVDKQTGDSADILQIQTQSGEQIAVNKMMVGGYKPGHAALNDYGQWDRSTDLVVYAFPDGYDNLASTQISNKQGTKTMNLGTKTYDARVVGYGVLKIMSDQEIDDFKQKYIEFLTTATGTKPDGSETQYGFKSGGIQTYGNAYIVNFLGSLDSDYYIDIFKDLGLKVSRCMFAGSGLDINCQIWG